MRIDWACAPFAVRLPPPQVLRLTTAMRNGLFGGIVGGLDAAKSRSLPPDSFSIRLVCLCERRIRCELKNSMNAWG